jgi:hypothetical protein
MNLYPRISKTKAESEHIKINALFFYMPTSFTYLAATIVGAAQTRLALLLAMHHPN